MAAAGKQSVPASSSSFLEPHEISPTQLCTALPAENRFGQSPCFVAFK